MSLTLRRAVVSTSTKPDVFEATVFRRWALGNCLRLRPDRDGRVPQGAYPLRWSPVVGCETFEPRWPWRHTLGSAARPGSVFTESAHWVERAEVLLAPLLFAANQRGAGHGYGVSLGARRGTSREPLAALEDSGHEMAQAVLAGVRRDRGP